MTVPVWAPFMLLTLICAVWPPPRWMRRLDWYKVGAWTGCVAGSLIVWVCVFLIVWWAA